MSRIHSRGVEAGEDDTALLAFYDDEQKIIVTIPLYVLNEITADQGPGEAREYILEQLAEILGPLTQRGTRDRVEAMKLRDPEFGYNWIWIVPAIAIFAIWGNSIDFGRMLFRRAASFRPWSAEAKRNVKPSTRSIPGQISSTT